MLALLLFPYDKNAFNDSLTKKYFLSLTAGICPIDDLNLPIVHIRDRANVARKNGPPVVENLLFSCGVYSDLERQRQLQEIELMETLLFENPEQVIKVDTLKLDGAFFRSPIEGNPRGRAIIESVVKMTKKLSMATVSEGVETFSQMDFLKKIDCDFIQGYVISKPIEIGMFETLAFGEEITNNAE